MADVFPDPRGENRLEARKPKTAEEMINHAYHDIDRRTWDVNAEGRDVCYLCAPGGYVLREGASTYSHESQRNPDTHTRNRRWMVIQWFKLQGLPIPRWPDAYRSSRDNKLWCHICRVPVGYYDREDGEIHDAIHDQMQQIIMRPNRLTHPKTHQRYAAGNHFLDNVMKAREPESEQLMPPPKPRTFIPDRNQPGHMRLTGMEQDIHTERKERGTFVMLNDGELRDLKEYWPQAADALGQHIPREILYETLIQPYDPTGLSEPKTIACAILQACVPGSERAAIRCMNALQCRCECHKDSIDYRIARPGEDA